MHTSIIHLVCAQNFQTIFCYPFYDPICELLPLKKSIELMGGGGVLTFKGIMGIEIAADYWKVFGNMGTKWVHGEILFSSLFQSTNML